MNHEWFQFAVTIALSLVGIVAGVIGWFLKRLVGDLDDLEEDEKDCRDEQGKHSREIRDTRQAISRIEGHLGMVPFPYTSE